jgi:hypothetical protein
MERKFSGWEYGWWWLHVYQVRSDVITWCCRAGGMFRELGLGLETLMVE